MNNYQLTSVAGLSEQISRSGWLATLLFCAVPPVREKQTEVSHMKNNGNQSQRIYDKATRTWYEVPEDQYREFDRWRTNLRKREQYWGRCFCPRGKWWLCDGDCVDCEFHTRNEVSLDDPLPSGLVKVKTGTNTIDAVYDAWYDKVYEPSATAGTSFAARA